MTRLDMSEYMEKYAVSRLIGAPPGYVGYEEGGQLTEAVRRRPYQVILLDEIEKAHPDVFNVLLQVLDDGRLTDGQGRTVSFKDTVVIMTSNVGSQLLGSLADEAAEQAVIDALRATFRPEFLNRIDEVIVFHSLDDEALGRIVDLLVADLAARLAEHDLTLELTPAARALIGREGDDPAVRRAAAEARDPAPHREPARAGAPRGPVRAGQHDRGRRRPGRRDARLLERRRVGRDRCRLRGATCARRARPWARASGPG